VAELDGEGVVLLRPVEGEDRDAVPPGQLDHLLS
jgi:hypothetical protein